ncbi:MAG: EVE domain-containing protein [Steroidobacteraceae bacterium]
MSFWLMKSEPDVFGIEDLAAAPRRTTRWDGVRNYQVRNMLRDQFAVGDSAFFYHSSCPEPGIAGVIEVVKAGYPDPTQFDRRSDYYDAAAHTDAPRWYSVDVRLSQRFSRVITLDELRAHASGALRDLLVLRRGNRLSITPIERAQWQFIVSLARR